MTVPLVPQSNGESPLREFNPCHGPADGKFCSTPGARQRGPRRDDAGPTQALYRGDAQQVAPSLDYASPGALFGAGIYLTDNKRVAGDYTVKGSNDVVFRYGGLAGRVSKQAVVDAYIRQQAQYFDKDGKPQEYPQSLSGFGPGFPPGTHAYRQHAQDQVRLQAAKQAYAKQAASLVVRVNADGTAVLVKKGAGQVSAFDVPKSWIQRTLDAEQETPERVAQAVSGVLSGRLRQESYAYA